MFTCGVGDGDTVIVTDEAAGDIVTLTGGGAGGGVSRCGTIYISGKGSRTRHAVLLTSEYYQYHCHDDWHHDKPLPVMALHTYNSNNYCSTISHVYTGGNPDLIYLWTWIAQSGFNPSCNRL